LLTLELTNYIGILSHMSMKKRQTFTLSPDVSNRAKQFARREGKSLSSLVEELLRDKTGGDDALQAGSSKVGSFSQRWKGKGRVSKKEDDRARRLRGRYGL